MQSDEKQEVNGLNTGVKSVLWSAAAAMLLVLMSVPMMNVLVVAFMTVPFAILYTMLPKGQFLLHAAASIALGYVLAGPAALVFGLFFLVPAVAAGHMYRRQANARTVITVVTIVILGQLLLELLLFSWVMQISLIGELGNIVRLLVSEFSAQNLLPPQWTDETTTSLIRLMTQSIPLVFIVFSFVAAAGGHWMARLLLRRSYGREVPGLPPAKDWMMPKSLVMYYLVALILQLVATGDHNSYLDVVLLNMVPLLRLVFAIQAIGFFFFLADQKGWHKAVPLLLAVPVILFPPLSLIGVLDVAFPIRKSFKRT
ncbi:DUF2232 domain-containing protein [Paenibacillus sp. SYP-B4298]|uniref:DUF2232 domain-containing protein n=1 Tax=Paenibacillus sp. SYP-B4298 TaxID=2996034 RepID=UPI0022DDEC3E|nr:DUF2232 domain-containing protein [Paenibacillus sp. SYP-B4298]